MNTIISAPHRERLQAALNHREADRIPLTLGSPSCSIHIDAHNRLLQSLIEQPEAAPEITDRILQIVKTDTRILDKFDVDLRWILPREAPVTWNDDHSCYVDEFGRRFIQGGGFFNQTDAPLLRHSIEELNAYEFPDLSRYHRFDHIPGELDLLSRDGYGIGIDGPWGIFEISSSLIGYEQYLMALADDPEYAYEIAEQVLYRHHFPFYEQLIGTLGNKIDIVGISDDLGSQTNLLISRKTYQKIFKPLHQKLIEHIHKLSPAKIYMHSDGAIYPILPDLIEIGVDGINPVQYTARNMDLIRLKNEFGKDLGFFGGVIENELLSYGTPQQIKETVQQNVEILKKDGGFIFAPIHNISQEVPAKNIIAMFEAGLAFGKY